MSIAEVKKTSEHKMQRTLETLKVDLAKVRSGRAHIGLLDHVQVEYYGSMVPINTVSNVTLIDSRTLGVQVWEKPMAQKVERAIRDSDLGLNPNSDGTAIRLTILQLTQERRQELVKAVNKKAEEAKVALRNIRRDGNEEMKKLEKGKEITEDESKRGQESMQKLVDKYIKQVDTAREAKEKEVLEV